MWKETDQDGVGGSLSTASLQAMSSPQTLPSVEGHVHFTIIRTQCTQTPTHPPAEPHATHAAWKPVLSNWSPTPSTQAPPEPTHTARSVVVPLLPMQILPTFSRSLMGQVLKTPRSRSPLPAQLVWTGKAGQPCANGEFATPVLQA